MSNPQINIVVPLFNEEEIFGDLMQRLTSVVYASKLSVSIIMVDDGSRDNTAFLMEQQSLRDERFVSVILSRNFGHQYALKPI